MKIFKKFSYLVAPAVLALPMVVSAQAINVNDIGGLDSTVNQIFNFIVPIFITAAILFTIYGALLLVFNGGDAEKRKKGKDIILWGLIGIFVMVSIFGLIRFFTNSVTFNNTAPPVITPLNV